jgi:hypothetical protein
VLAQFGGLSYIKLKILPEIVQILELEDEGAEVLHHGAHPVDGPGRSWVVPEIWSSFRGQSHESCVRVHVQS